MTFSSGVIILFSDRDHELDLAVVVELERACQSCCGYREVRWDASRDDQWCCYCYYCYVCLLGSVAK